jgi:hypothetical protein
VSRLRGKILKLGEHMDEELETTIILTAGEINLGLQAYGELIIDLLPKAMGRFAHKSFLYGSLVTKLDALLAKTAIEEVINSELPRAFKEADKMACKACIRFLGCLWINGMLEESIFIKIIQKLASKPSKLVALTFITTLPLLLKIKKNVLIEEAFKSMAEFYEKLDCEVPSYLEPIRRFDATKDFHIKCTPVEESKAETVEPSEDAKVEETKAEEPKVEEPKVTETVAEEDKLTFEEEKKPEGTLRLFERLPLETLEEDEYEDVIDYPVQESKYEIT